MAPLSPREAVAIVVRSIDDWIGHDLCGMCAIKATAAQYQLDTQKITDIYIQEKVKGLEKD